MNNSLQSAQSIASVYLANFANSENFWQDFELAFGSNYDRSIALNIQKNLANKTFTLPEIVIVDRQILGTPDGAFAAGNNTIYLSNYFVNNNDSQRVAATLIEEIGHWIDAQINTQDSAGDEGQIFSVLVMGETLNPTKLARLKAENDHAVIQINGQQLNIEQANITGTSGSDTLSGTALADTINALAGDDSIDGGAGNDILNGGDGNDYIHGGSSYLSSVNDGNDKIDGGAGNDYIIAGGGTNTVNGGTGIDTIEVDLSGNTTNLIANISTGSFTLAGTTFTNVERFGLISTGSGNDTITGGAYDDNIYSGAGNDTINAGAGNDTIGAGAGTNTVNGGTGIDTIVVDLSSSTTNLTANISTGSLTLAGTTFNNVEQFGLISTGSGNDTITGGAYKDYIYSGAGNDTVNAGAGDDDIESGDGNDTINGGAGNDRISDDSGNNFIDGAAGDDHIYSGAGNDTINGGAGNDRINDYGGNNFIDGAAGDDDIESGDGNDTLNGGAGNDVIRGDGGSDSITGGAGNDTIYGDDGSAGSISFSSNDGDDTYIFNTGFGRDTIHQAGSGTDTVKFGAGLTLAKFQIYRQDNDLIFAVKGTNDTLTIKDGLDTYGSNFVTSVSDVIVERFQFDNGATTKTLEELEIGPDPANLSLTGTSKNIIKIGGESKIKFTINQDKSDRVTQIFAFKVDDLAGNINGIAPTATDYAAQAVSKAKVIFSSIVNPPAGFDRSELARIVTDFKPNDLIGFYAVQDNSPIFLGTTPNSTNFKATDLGNNSIGLNWGSGDNRLNIDIVATQTTETPRVNTTTQNNTEGLALDLTKITLPADQVNFTVYREATHNNSVGFYKVLDASGAIQTSTGILNPQDAGYVQAAVQAAVSKTLGADVNLTTNNQSSITIDATLDKSLYMPIITVNGTLYEAAAGKNLGQTYTSFLGANPDKANHIRLLGDNTFGFEDLNGGGDLDFNDIIVKAQVG